MDSKTVSKVKDMYSNGYCDAAGVHHFPSIAELVTKLGLDVSSVSELRRISASEGWASLRNINKESVEQAKRIAFLQKRGEDARNFDDDIFLISKAGLNHIKKHFNNAQEAGRVLPAKELTTIAGALAKFQVAGRIALGDTKQEIHEKMDNKLDLESLTKDELKVLQAIMGKALSTEVK